MKLEHFHSDMGTNSNLANKKPYHPTPSKQTVQQAMTLGRVVVGDADIIYQSDKRNAGYIVVIKHIANGMSGNIYRDMYRIL